MNAAWLLKSSTLWWVLCVSTAASLAFLFLMPEGLPSLKRRQAELHQQKQELLEKTKRNRELAEEVRRLAAKDPELMEALCRRQGYARPGETVYTFRDRGSGR